MQEIVIKSLVVMLPMDRRKWGKAGEDLAAHFLEQSGLKILERNFRFERGEIDLIAEDGEELVFVEVKARRSNAFGAPEDAVTEKKQEQVHAVADGYLFMHNIDDRPCRFDIVAIEYRNENAEIHHIRDAF
jgi:putative endonuclease